MCSMRPPRIFVFAPIVLSLVVTLMTIAIHAAEKDTDQDSKPSAVGRKSGKVTDAAIPSTGQTIDTKKAVDVVKAEVEGGEADSATGPTPSRFLWQEADESLIVDKPYRLSPPVGLGPVAAVIPLYNLMTAGKLKLGKQLYYDQRMSADSTVSCASCHDPNKGWTDNKVTSVGIGNQLGARNSPTVLNTVYARSLFWDGRAPSLEGQAQGPIQNKIEMGDQSYRQIIERLRTIPSYRDQFRQVFGTEITLDGVAKAIATFERTALSGDSAYDRYAMGDPDEDTTYTNLTLEQKRGMVLFGIGMKMDDPDKDKIDSKLKGRANCTACHAGDNFSDEMFHNLGVGLRRHQGRSIADLGRWVIAPIGAKSNSERGRVQDAHRCATSPGPRPYMHDGSEATLEAVVEFYNKGGNKNPACSTRRWARST